MTKSWFGLFSLRHRVALFPLCKSQFSVDEFDNAQHDITLVQNGGHLVFHVDKKKKPPEMRDFWFQTRKASLWKRFSILVTSHKYWCEYKHWPRTWHRFQCCLLAGARAGWELWLTEELICCSAGLGASEESVHSFNHSKDLPSIVFMCWQEQCQQRVNCVDDCCPSW